MGKVRCSFGIQVAVLVTVFLASVSFTKDVFALGTNEGPGVTDTSIKIGYIGDITGPVVVATGPFRRGIEVYLKYVNEEKNGVSGRKIDFIAEDDRYQVPLAMAAFEKLVDRDNVFAILGFSGSTQLAALDSRIAKAGIPVFAPQQTSDFQLKNPYMLNMLSTYSDQNKIGVEYALKELAKQGKSVRMAAFTNRAESGFEWAKDTEKNLAAHGHKMLAHLTVDDKAVEASSQMNDLKKLEVNYVMSKASPANEILYLKEALRYGLRIPTIASSGGFSENTCKTAGEEASKQYFGLHSYSPSNSQGKGPEELRQMTSKYGKQEDLAHLFYVMGYTSAKVFVEVLNRAGRNLTRKSFFDALYTIRGFDTQGLSAPVTFGPTDNHGISGSRLYGYDFKAQQIIPKSEWMEP